MRRTGHERDIFERILLAGFSCEDVPLHRALYVPIIPVPVPVPLLYYVVPCTPTTYFLFHISHRTTWLYTSFCTRRTCTRVESAGVGYRIPPSPKFTGYKSSPINLCSYAVYALGVSTTVLLYWDTYELRVALDVEGNTTVALSPSSANVGGGIYTSTLCWDANGT